MKRDGQTEVLHNCVSHTVDDLARLLECDRGSIEKAVVKCSKLFVDLRRRIAVTELFHNLCDNSAKREEEKAHDDIEDRVEIGDRTSRHNRIP